MPRAAAAPRWVFRNAAPLRRELQEKVDFHKVRLDALGAQIYGTDYIINRSLTELERTFRMYYGQWRDAKIALAEIRSDPRGIPLQPILDEVRSWPEVVSIEHIAHVSHPRLVIRFCPVLIDGNVTSLLEFEIDRQGFVCGGEIEIHHPHVQPHDICLGGAYDAFSMARQNGSLMGVLTILRQYIGGYDDGSELNHGWRHGANRWWNNNAFGKSEFLGWDCHTVLDPDNQETKYVELIYGQPLRKIMEEWSNQAQNHRGGEREDEDEDDCMAHCDACGGCIPDGGDYEHCEDCGCYFCEYEELVGHQEVVHHMFPCSQQENNWEHAGGPVFTDNKCQIKDCGDYVCTDCMQDHLDEAHEDEESDDIVDIPAPLPGQTPLPAMFTVHHPDGSVTVEHNGVNREEGHETDGYETQPIV